MRCDATSSGPECIKDLLGGPDSIFPTFVSGRIQSNAWPPAGKAQLQLHSSLGLVLGLAFRMYIVRNEHDVDHKSPMPQKSPGAGKGGWEDNNATARTRRFRSSLERVGHDNNNTTGHELLCPICSMPDMITWTYVLACSAGPKVGSPGRAPIHTY